MRVLVCGVGYRFLRDNAVGVWITDTLAPQASNGIEFEDLGYHPVGFTQNLNDRPPYDRIVFVGAVDRGRPPGTVKSVRYDHVLPGADEVQERVADSVTGSISLDNLVIVAEAFKALPEDVWIVEIEPADETWGDGFSPEIEAKLPEIMETVWSLTRL
ncbi:MAG TPA: hydrogenase maturation protease [Solirubrobacteraceae bacterium]|nr:hydrogenase maturation protease [Solirubrobacteraceae bacterium]